MALPDKIQVQNGTALTFRSSGGDAAINLASLANAAARQSAKLDLGTPRAELFEIFAELEFAATPTAGLTVDLFWAPSRSGTAANDNPANVTGSDGSYAGYSSNLNDSLKQLVFLGSHTLTAQATSTVQKSIVGVFAPTSRYGSLIVVNNSGAALHSSAANMVITITPIEGAVVD